MNSIISTLLLAGAAILSIPVCVFFIEVIASFRPVRAKNCEQGSLPTIAVLVPAHNESSHLLPTIQDIKAQLLPSDRVVVVADNCSDDTASVALRAGAEVIVRDDQANIGKGYALDFGIQYLAQKQPDIVIFIDADCRLSFGALPKLASESQSAQLPVQALYLMLAPDQSPANQRISEFAWRVKNQVRPLGLRAMGMPCQLVGTGMAFPWDVIRSAKLASQQIVEDLQLGLDLAIEGRPPRFIPEVLVTSRFPQTVEAATSQRRRWEHGHIALIIERMPTLLLEAFRHRDPKLFVLALDLAVPPLVLLAFILVGAIAGSGIAAGMGASHSAVLLSVINFAVFILALLFCWIGYGRDLISAAECSFALKYVLEKIASYKAFLTRGRVSRWIRTDRDD